MVKRIKQKLRGLCSNNKIYDIHIIQVPVGKKEWGWERRNNVWKLTNLVVTDSNLVEEPEWSQTDYV